MFEHLFSMDGPYARIMNWVWDVLILSILWFVCCIPVVTIGASCTAAYYATSKVIRHHTGRIHQEFFSSFKRNIRQSIPLTVLFLLFKFVIVIECLYFYSDTRFPVAVLYFFYSMLLAVLGCALYLWACLSRFDRSSFALLRMSVILTFRHLLTTVLLLSLMILTILGIYLMPWGILVFPGFMYVLSSYLMERILLKYSPKVSENDPEGQKWYYQ